MLTFSKQLLALCTAVVLAPSMGTAQSACPTADMLNGNGILFTQDNGDNEIHQLTPEGSILQRAVYGGRPSVNYLAHGVHVLKLSNEENGSILPDSIFLFDFGMPITDLPVPVAGGTWSATTTLTNMGSSEHETVHHRWGLMTLFPIGSCIMDAIPVTIKYNSDDYNHTEETMYFPDLGTAIVTAYADSVARREYTYVDVRGN